MAAVCVSNNGAAVDGVETCSVCLDNNVDVMVNNCRHKFCCICMIRWREIRNVCPVCIQEVDFISEIAPVSSNVQMGPSNLYSDDNEESSDSSEVSYDANDDFNTADNHQHIEMGPSNLYSDDNEESSDSSEVSYDANDDFNTADNHQHIEMGPSNLYSDDNEESSDSSEVSYDANDDFNTADNHQHIDSSSDTNNTGDGNSITLEMGANNNMGVFIGQPDEDDDAINIVLDEDTDEDYDEFISDNNYGVDNYDEYESNDNEVQ